MALAKISSSLSWLKAMHQRQMRYATFLGRTAVHVPLFYNCVHEHTAKTYALILKTLEFNRDSLTPTEIRAEIAIEWKDTNGTLGFPPPSKFSEKTYSMPSVDSIQDCINDMKKWGYVVIDTDYQPVRVFDKLSHKYMLTAIGRIASFAFIQVQNNINKYIEANSAFRDVIGEFLIENNMRNLFRHLYDEVCFIVLRDRAYHQKQAHELYPDCPEGREPRNDFESYSDEKITSFQELATKEAFKRVMNGIKGNESNGAVRKEFDRFISMAKNKHPKAKKLLLTALDYFDAEADQRKAERQKMREEILKGQKKEQSVTFTNLGSSEF